MRPKPQLTSLAVTRWYRSTHSRVDVSYRPRVGQTVHAMYSDTPRLGDESLPPIGGHGIELEVTKLPEAKPGFVLLPRQWVGERSFA
jgi:hypothetical protein